MPWRLSTCHICNMQTLYFVCVRCAHGYNKSNGVLDQTWGGSTRYLCTGVKKIKYSYSYNVLVMCQVLVLQVLVLMLNDNVLIIYEYICVLFNIVKTNLLVVNKMKQCSIIFLNTLFLYD